MEPVDDGIDWNEVRFLLFWGGLPMLAGVIFAYLDFQFYELMTFLMIVCCISIFKVGNRIIEIVKDLFGRK